MTDTDHQPHTTTDDLTDWLADQLAAGMGLPWAHLDEPSREPWRARARALLTSEPLADRLNAHARITAALAAYEATIGTPEAAYRLADRIRRIVRGDR